MFMLTQAQNILDYSIAYDSIAYDISFCLLHKTRHKIFTIPSRSRLDLEVDDSKIHPGMFSMKGEVLYGFTNISHGF